MGATAASSAVRADIADVAWMARVAIEKSGEHCVDHPSGFNRYRPAIPPVATANPGDMIVFRARDALDTV